MSNVVCFPFERTSEIARHREIMDRCRTATFAAFKSSRPQDFLEAIRILDQAAGRIDNVQICLWRRTCETRLRNPGPPPHAPIA